MTFSPAEIAHLQATFGELSPCAGCGLPALLLRKDGTPMHVMCSRTFPSANNIAVRALMRKEFPDLQEMGGNGVGADGTSASTEEMEAWQRWNASRPTLNLNQVANERDSYIRHSRKKKWWSE